MNQLIYKKIALPVLILFSQISQTCSLIMEFMHLYIQTATIKLFMQVLIFRLPTPHRLIWYYKKADTSNIRKVLDLINWEKLLSHKNINAQVAVVNEIILNRFRNYVRNKYITCDDKDPVWMNEKIKSKIKSIL